MPALYQFINTAAVWMSIAMGFSERTCFLASRAFSIKGGWMGMGSLRMCRVSRILVEMWNWDDARNYNSLYIIAEEETLIIPFLPQIVRIDIYALQTFRCGLR
jgi:hypothetical protein